MDIRCIPAIYSDCLTFLCHSYTVRYMFGCIGGVVTCGSVTGGVMAPPLGVG